MNKVGLGVIIGVLITWGLSDSTYFHFSLKNIALYLGIGLVFLLVLLAVVWVQWRIERVHRNTEKKVRGEYEGQTLTFADGRAREIREKVRPELEKLERLKKFLFKLLTFLRK